MWNWPQTPSRRRSCGPTCAGGASATTTTRWAGSAESPSTCCATSAAAPAASGGPSNASAADRTHRSGRRREPDQLDVLLRELPDPATHRRCPVLRRGTRCRRGGRCDADRRGHRQVAPVRRSPQAAGRHGSGGWMMDDPGTTASSPLHSSVGLTPWMSATSTQRRRGAPSSRTAAEGTHRRHGALGRRPRCGRRRRGQEHRWWAGRRPHACDATAGRHHAPAGSNDRDRAADDRGFDDDRARDRAAHVRRQRDDESGASRVQQPRRIDHRGAGRRHDPSAR